MSAQLSRYSQTEYNRSQRVLARLRDIYSSARVFHSSHAEILADMSAKIYATKDFAKLTPYYRGMFAGVRETLSDELYRHHLEWRLYLDGRLVTSKEVPEGQWSRVRGGEHVWADAPDRIFSTPEEDLTPAPAPDKVHA